MLVPPHDPGGAFRLIRCPLAQRPDEVPVVPDAFGGNVADHVTVAVELDPADVLVVLDDLLLYVHRASARLRVHLLVEVLRRDGSRDELDPKRPLAFAPSRVPSQL